MSLTEEEKRKIEKEERFRAGVKKTLKKEERSKGCSGCFISSGKGLLLFVLIGVGLSALVLVFSPGTREGGSSTLSTEGIEKIEVAGQTIEVGDLADDVFAIVAEYRIDTPTIADGRITHHYLADKVLFDLTFQRKGGPYYLTKIVIKDRNYQDKTAETVRATLGEPPIEYETGHSSGVLITVSVPVGTTKEGLKELLRYFHSLNEKGLLSKAMKGNTVIDVFDDKKWTIKENYDAITEGVQYCDYIRATYSVGLDGVERASIGVDGCPNYEEVKF